MKILHIISGLGSGGAQKLLEDLLPIMSAQGDNKIDLLVLNDKNRKFDKKLIASGIKIHAINLNSQYNPLNIFYIIKFLKNNKYDIAHVHLFPTVYWVSLASRFIKKNRPILVYTEHSTHNRRREKRIFKYIDTFMYSMYDKIISISNKTEKYLLDWLNVSEERNNKFQVIYNGVDIKKFLTANPYSKKKIKTFFEDNDYLLCMVGRFSKQKDQMTVIRAMSKLSNNYHLLLIGEGKLLGQCKELVENMGLNDRVHFLGFRSDIERIYKTVDLIILSSHWEGFGLAAVEGMASGKPVIASRVDGLSEVVEGAGVLFNKGDFDDLAYLINNIIHDRHRYEEIANKSSKRSELYSIKDMANKYLKVYSKLRED